MSDVRVLVVVPAHEYLRESARSSMTASTRKLSNRPPEISSAIDLDEGFAAVPLARTGFTARPDLATASAAPQFIIRGRVSKKNAAKALQDRNVFSDPRIAAFPTCGGTPSVGMAADVERLLDLTALTSMGLDGAGVAVAIVDTGINLAHVKTKKPGAKLDAAVAWAPAGTVGAPGSYPVGHGTMCAFGALIAAPAATLIDVPLLSSVATGGSQMDGFLSDALQAYAHLMQVMMAPGWSYKALVVNNSWGMYHHSWDFPAGHPGRYADNPNHPFNTMVGTLARRGADILFAAGNCGKQCPDDRCEGVTSSTITGANAHPDVLTVAGIDTKRNRVGYSSQGPAVAGMKHAKPDIAAYTHFEGSEAFGAGEPDTGTSTACPVAAGCVATVRTKMPTSQMAPQDLSRELRADARHKSGVSGWNANLGYGIVNPAQTAARLLAII